MQELTKIGRILFSKKSFCSGVTAGIAAPSNEETPVRSAKGAAQAMRPGREFSFMGVLWGKHKGRALFNARPLRTELGDQFLRNVTEVVGKAEGAAIVVVDEFLVVEAHQA